MVCLGTASPWSWPLSRNLKKGYQAVMTGALVVHAGGTLEAPGKVFCSLFLNNHR